MEWLWETTCIILFGGVVAVAYMFLLGFGEVVFGVSRRLEGKRIDIAALFLRLKKDGGGGKEGCLSL